MIIAPSRMEPALIDDPSPALRAECQFLIDAAARLLSVMPPDRRPALRRAVAASSAWHSSRIEGRLCDRQTFLEAMLGSGERDDAGVIDECLALSDLHEQAAAAPCGIDPCDPARIRALHGMFCASAPRTGGSTCPGAFRQCDVEVGVHVAPPHDVVDVFMGHFQRRFRQDWLHGDVARLLATATSHHRLAWIHPFEDGNGRIARLHSDAMLACTRDCASGLWSLARALACSEGGIARYHGMMALADRPRQGDRDGRGNLSLAALETYALWFIKACRAEIERRTQTAGSAQGCDLTTALEL